jgi:hypothetical protein
MVRAAVTFSLLLAMASCTIVPTQTHQEKFEFFREGAQKYCGGLVGVHWFPEYNGFGLVANADLDDKTKYCRIPSELILTTWDDFPGKDVVKPSDEAPRLQLVVYLLYMRFVRKDLDDFRVRYVHSLPDDQKTMVHYS